MSVSHDTMRPEDLIPEFLYVLQQLNRGKYILMKDHPEDWDSEECSDYLAELFDVLDQEAPVGFYFGARMGDGSDYGFWEAEEI
ncbi:MAG: hypothetical protein C0610_16695 [Desulfobacteraceae bacterium]|nr:MAG: hypothetical protein C0610_16695 [Desulfobacteraceae bacterium]